MMGGLCFVNEEGVKRFLAGMTSRKYRIIADVIDPPPYLA